MQGVRSCKQGGWTQGGGGWTQGGVGKAKRLGDRRVRAFCIHKLA